MDNKQEAFYYLWFFSSHHKEWFLLLHYYISTFNFIAINEGESRVVLILVLSLLESANEILELP